LLGLLRRVAVKKYRGVISALVILALISLSCAQTPKKKEAEPFLAAIPQLLWQYDTGG